LSNRAPAEVQRTKAGHPPSPLGYGGSSIPQIDFSLKNRCGIGTELQPLAIQK